MGARLAQASGTLPMLRRQPCRRLFSIQRCASSLGRDRPLGTGLRLDPKWSVSGGWTLLPVLTSSALFPALRKWASPKPGRPWRTSPSWYRGTWYTSPSWYRGTWYTSPSWYRGGDDGRPRDAS